MEKRMVARLLGFRDWDEIEHFSDDWRHRISYMASFLEPTDRSVLDLGCGNSWLKDYLPEGVRYYGCDYTPRDHTDFVCDFCKRQFPPSSLRVDAMFASGVLEYVKDPRWFIRCMCAGANQKVILSYVTVDAVSGRRRRGQKGWKSHLAREGVLRSFQSCGYELAHLQEGVSGNNDVFVFRPKSR